jgi:prepilin-type N-terminal cleavage/methylation domain-containing protein/prepilin-type processing-associated H-X9-DG protein
VAAARLGFTIVELLVVIAIIGILIALLLPAIQAAREASRRTQCANQLRQLAISFHNHHDTHKHLPTGGWHWSWLGYPDYGYGRDQPGGWMYNILPFMEEGDLHDYGQGLTAAERDAATRVRVQRPFEGMTCPSRRRANVYAFVNSPPKTFAFCETIEVSSKTDYAANVGDLASPELSGGPVATGSDNDETIRDTYDWSDFGSGAYSLYQGESKATGVVFGRSEINFRQILDGTAKTYMVGEKYMSTDNYDDGLDWGDNEPAFSGNNTDTLRTTAPRRDNFPGGQLPLRADQPGPSGDGSFDPTKRTDPGFGGELIFGSAHSAGFNMAFCDGSARMISFDINPDLHRTYGHRYDAVDLPEE